MRRPEHIQEDLDEVAGILAELPSDGGDPFSSTALTRTQYTAELTELRAELADATTAILDLTLDGSAVYGDTVRVDVLSKVLTRLQDAVTAIGQALTGPVTARGQVGGDLVALNQLRLAGTFAGSFGAHLRGPIGSSMPPMFGEDAEESLLERSIGEVMHLVEVAQEAEPGNDDGIVEAVLPMGPRAVGHLKELTSALATTNTNVRMLLRRPLREDREVVVRQAVARRLQTVLTRTTMEEETIDVTGLLGGASQFRNAFELRVGETTYTGKVADELVPRLAGAFGQACRATLLIRRSVTDAAQRPKESFTLVDLEVL